ncbi:DUF1292 domain-containing protein [Peptoniphilus sp. GNH]|nr:DUF1292 domain-containing protein [Peptoniphilus sp. GNH]
MKEEKKHCGCGCGHDHEHGHAHEDENLDVITFTSDDGTEMEYVVIGDFPYKNKNYLALLPSDEEDQEAIVCEYIQGQDEEIEILEIEDEDYFNEVVAEFLRLYDEEGEEEE